MNDFLCLVVVKRKGDNLFNEGFPIEFIFVQNKICVL